MSLSSAVLKSPMRITHLNLLSEWSGFLNYLWETPLLPLIVFLPLLRLSRIFLTVFILAHTTIGRKGVQKLWKILFFSLV